MILPTSNNISFKGYDARRLSGFLMACNYQNIANEMIDIGKKEGFDVFYSSRLTNLQVIKLKEFLPFDFLSAPWMQDYIGIVKKSVLAKQDIWGKHIADYFGYKQNSTQQKLLENYPVDKLQSFLDAGLKKPLVQNGQEVVRWNYKNETLFIPIQMYQDKKEKVIDIMKSIAKKTHIKGGNYFIVKGENGKDELLIGQDELKKFDVDTIKNMFGVEKVVALPQMDFHLDLFVRPLSNKQVLVTDDKLMLDVFDEVIEKAKLALKNSSFFNISGKKLLKHFIESMKKHKKSFELEISKNQLARTDDVETVLIKNGFTPIRVPGRIYKTTFDSDGKELVNIFNMINSNVLLNKNNELVYILNDSSVDSALGLTPKIQKKIGFSFRENIKKNLSPFVSKEHVHFVLDNKPFNLLAKYQGSVHCVCAEVPLGL